VVPTVVASNVAKNRPSIASVVRAPPRGIDSIVRRDGARLDVIAGTAFGERESNALLSE
jgi:hypothetical protein